MVGRGSTVVATYDRMYVSYTSNIY